MNGSISQSYLSPTGIPRDWGKESLTEMFVGKQVLCGDVRAQETTAKKPNAAAGCESSVLMELDFLLPFLLEIQSSYDEIFRVGKCKASNFCPHLN